MSIRCYAYDAAIHCIGCTRDRFPAADEDNEDENGCEMECEDSEGNPVHAVFSWDGTPMEGEYCDDCHEEISEPNAVYQAVRGHESGEFDGLVVSDTSEVPDDYCGLVLHINDHGNAELYAADCTEMKSLGGIV